MHPRTPGIFQNKAIDAAVLRRALGVVGCGLLIMSLGGCNDEIKATDAGLGQVEGVDLEAAAEESAQDDAGEIADDAAPTRTVEDLAEQFERDAEAFRSLRGSSGSESGREGGGRDATGGDAGRPAVGPPRRPIVQFNDSTGSSGERSTGGKATSDPGSDDVGETDVANTRDDDGSTDSGDASPTVDPDAPPEVRLREAMVSLRRELYRSASYDSAPLRQYLAMAAMTMVDPERALEPEALYDLTERERQLLAAYQSFFIEAGRELRETGDVDALVTLVDELRMSVTNTGPLKVARAELCTVVEGFGRYTTFDKYAFLAGEAQQAVLYTEIDEFTSKQNEKGEWVTDLWQELVIYSQADSVPVWYQEWQPVTDVAKRKRHDFYISHLITLPSRLTVGSYILKVRVKDDATGSIAEAGIPFKIVADSKLAATIGK